MTGTGGSRGKWLCLALAMLFLLSVISCGQNGTADGTTEPQTSAEPVTEAPPTVIRLTGEYILIRPDKASDAVVDACKQLRTAMGKKLGNEPEFKSDFLNEKAGYRESPYEIIVGDCDRDASRKAAEGLRYRDYVIRVSGTQLVILGGNDEATVKAVDKFIGMLDPGAEYTEGELYRFDAEYPVTSLKLNGADISGYRIVVSASEKNNYLQAADTFNDRLRSVCGVTLPVITSKEEASEREIQLGDCGRGPSDGIKMPDGLNRTLSTDGKSIAFASSGALLSAEAVRNFLDAYIPADAAGTLDVSVPAGTDTAAVSIGKPLTEGAQVRFMSSNILGDSTLSERAPILLRVYMEYFPAVIGMQECNSVGHANVVRKLGEFYDAACTKIGSTSKSCFTPILYRRDHYTLVASDSFLYDSRWTETDTKTLSWAVLQDRQSGKLVAVINTHGSLILGSYDTEKVFGKKLDPTTDGNRWREDNSRQIIETKNMILEKYGRDVPVVVMGDLNANLNAKSVTMLNTDFRNCINAARVSKTTGVNSYHNDPGQKPTGTSPIDHMLVTPGSTNVYTHLILMTQDGIDCSDHCPLICELAFQ